MNTKSLNKLSERLLHFKQKQFTGQIKITGNDRTTWRIYLCLGRLVWADGGVHPYRSWKRAIDKYCHRVDWDSCQINFSRKSDSGDYHILKVLLERRFLEREQAIELVKTKATEILFDLLQLEDKEQLSIESEKTSTSSFLTSGLQMSISLVNMEQVLRNAQQEWLTWQKKGLGKCSPNLAPAMRKQERLQKEVSGVVYQNFLRLLDGKRTLRDLSSRIGKDLCQLTSSLIPYIQQNLLYLTEVGDIIPSYNSKKLAENKPAKDLNRPLIACIDDSPQIGKILEQIITKQGYRCVSIQEPLQALPSLIKTTPDLIFLDIGMPIVNGYEICTQVRRVSKLKNIPIIFLTGNDGIIDRVRARVSGANAFITKPIEIDKITVALDKYVSSKSVSGDRVSIRQGLAS